MGTSWVQADLQSSGSFKSQQLWEGPWLPRNNVLSWSSGVTVIVPFKLLFRRSSLYNSSLDSHLLSASLLSSLINMFQASVFQFFFSSMSVQAFSVRAFMEHHWSHSCRSTPWSCSDTSPGTFRCQRWHPLASLGPNRGILRQRTCSSNFGFLFTHPLLHRSGAINQLIPCYTCFHIMLLWWR